MTQVVSLQEAYKTIKQLMKEQKWLEAHRACLEGLRFDPENLTIIHFKNTIEKKVKKINIKVIKSDLQKLKPLWSQHKYQEILTSLKELEPYIKEYPALKNLILKAKKKYEQQIRGQSEGTYQEETKKIADLLKQNKFQEALLAAEHLRIIGIHSQELQKLIISIRSQWIDHELNDNKTLISGQKFEDILLFYQKLLKIDPNSTKIKSAIEQTKKGYHGHNVDEKKEFIYKSLEEIKTLYQLKKYEKAYEACAEILAIDPENKTALTFQKHSAKKTQKLIDNEVIAQMLSTQKTLKQERKKDPKGFVRLWP